MLFLLKPGSIGEKVPWFYVHNGKYMGLGLTNAKFFLFAI
jgi:hypothetical protein